MLHSIILLQLKSSLGGGQAVLAVIVRLIIAECSGEI